MKTYKLDKNGHPTPEACRAVAAQIRNALKKYPDMGLDMMEERVKRPAHQTHWCGTEHACGTVHCHAGTFLLGAEDLDTSRESIGYEEGVLLMIGMLGFKDDDDRPQDKLEDWANDNPARWGNSNGSYVWCYEGAFDGATNVSQIADWWDDVADRSEKLNNEEES